MSHQSNDQYDGSKLFIGLSTLTGFPLDLINFLLAQAFALIAAGIIRSTCKKSPANIKLILCLVLGIFIGIFCYGVKSFHLVFMTSICYLLIRYGPQQNIGNTVLGVSIGYLSIIHLHRQFYLHDTCNLDITGPLMVIIQRITSVAYCIQDGRDKKKTPNDVKADDYQYHQVILEVPSFLEFFSYSLAFQTLLCGPAVSYTLYIDFIHSREPEAQLLDEPNRKLAVKGKLLGALLAAVIHLILTPTYSVDALANEPSSEWSPVYVLWFCYLATLAVRCKYYLAWLLADAVCNNSGIGYRAPANWDKVTNVDIFGFETATTFREAVAKWNPGTNAWLRLAIYDRVKSAKTLKTYALSAIWHGFYPGYYLTFATGALFTMTGRKVRKFAQPFTWSSSKLYNALAFALTRIFMTYATVPFVILDFAPSIAFYRRLFFLLHWIALGALFLPTTSAKKVTSNGTANGANHTNGKIKSG